FLGGLFRIGYVLPLINPYWSFITPAWAFVIAVSSHALYNNILTPWFGWAVGMAGKKKEDKSAIQYPLAVRQLASLMSTKSNLPLIVSKDFIAWTQEGIQSGDHIPIIFKRIEKGEEETIARKSSVTPSTIPRLFAEHSQEEYTKILSEISFHLDTLKTKGQHEQILVSLYYLLVEHPHVFLRYLMEKITFVEGLGLVEAVKKNISQFDDFTPEGISQDGLSLIRNAVNFTEEMLYLAALINELETCRNAARKEELMRSLSYFGYVEPLMPYLRGKDRRLQRTAMEVLCYTQRKASHELVVNFIFDGIQPHGKVKGAISYIIFYLIQDALALNRPPKKTSFIGVRLWQGNKSMLRGMRALLIATIEEYPEFALRLCFAVKSLEYLERRIPGLIFMIKQMHEMEQGGDCFGDVYVPCYERRKLYECTLRDIRDELNWSVKSLSPMREFIEEVLEESATVSLYGRQSVALFGTAIPEEKMFGLLDALNKTNPKMQSIFDILFSDAVFMTAYPEYFKGTKKASTHEFILDITHSFLLRSLAVALGGETQFTLEEASRDENKRRAIDYLRTWEDREGADWSHFDGRYFTSAMLYALLCSEDNDTIRSAFESYKIVEKKRVNDLYLLTGFEKAVICAAIDIVGSITQDRAMNNDIYAYLSDLIPGEVQERPGCIVDMSKTFSEDDIDQIGKLNIALHMTWEEAETAYKRQLKRIRKGGGDVKEATGIWDRFGPILEQVLPKERNTKSENAPAGMIDRLNKPLIKRFGRTTAARMSFITEEPLFAGLLLNILPWFLAVLGFLDPAHILLFYIISNFLFGFLHETTYKWRRSR
ncbi:MAG: hypothetical protein HQ575_04580, partial [Candidatus Omnitrophica bacterium]|nr:hypothetical protein [Candidatus Omnitrophota bacterium]